ncbi:MlaD family protein [Patulibacter minatonensis]|uniref:MlaD family protein n=1 Tax=Patulibacter minatonensis TaxID=298163 RepID=UPI00047B066B|nr:MlaD family protein [Patulibacter minatonensis]
MRRWRGQARRLLTIAALAAVGLLVAGAILGGQKASLPGWVPGAPDDPFVIDARFASAAGVMPGQGQAVTIAGVSVGKVGGVRLDRGQAVVRLDLERRYAGRVRPDAHVLLRPKTPLKDMIVELDPGTAQSGAPLKDGAELSVAAGAPDVGGDEILAMLDTDTRAALGSLLGNAGTAIGGDGGRRLARALKRFEPLSRRTAEASRLLAARGTMTRRLITNLGSITQELGGTDARLTAFVRDNAALFARFARQDRGLSNTVRALPATLDASTSALQKVGDLSATLDRALPAVRPATSGLAPALRQVRPFLAKTRPALEHQLRPFARKAQPVAARLRPGVAQAASGASSLERLTTTLNHLTDALAYDPPGDGVGKQSYLFSLPWAGHNTNSVVSTQDALGPLPRSITLFSCGAQVLLDNYTNPKGVSDSPYIKTLIDLLNPPRTADNCPKGISTKSK